LRNSNNLERVNRAHFKNTKRETNVRKQSVKKIVISSIIPLLVVSAVSAQIKSVDVAGQVELVAPLAQIRFEDVTEQVGLIDPLKGMRGHAAAWGDVNDDGYPDLFMGTFAGVSADEYNKRGHTTGPEPNKLLINNGGQSFSEVFDTPIRVKGECSGAAFADFDNDGDTDLVVSHNSRPHQNEICKTGNKLYRNNGNGTFSDVTMDSNIDFGDRFKGRNTFVLDYDGDGLLDLFMQEDDALKALPGASSRLMRNLGNLEFQDVTVSAGLPDDLYGLGGAVGDINGDTWPDIFFAHKSVMFINNRNGTFHPLDYVFIDPKYTEPRSTNTDWSCGADMGDLDNDGDLDLVMGQHFDSHPATLRVYLNKGNDNNGDPIFENITLSAGIEGINTRQPHVSIQDFDNDGKMDILSSTKNYFVYQNIGNSQGVPHFAAPVSSGVSGGLAYWAAGGVVDYDRDGRLDFFGPEWFASSPSVLLRNVTANTGNFIDIEINLTNHPGNRHGIGAMVQIFKPGQAGQHQALLGTKDISISNGYSSGTTAVAHFGVADYTQVDVVVTMPNDGPIYTVSSVPTNQRFTVSDGSSQDTFPPFTTAHNPAKDADAVPINANIIVHVEDNGAGVDRSSIVMKVDGSEVSPTITGSPADYTLTYDPPADFNYDQEIFVTIEAKDLTSPPNIMPQDSYSFRTAAMDTIPPTISYVSAVSATEVDVVFSEPVDESSAENIANYSIDNGISVVSATLDDDLRTIHLITDPHSEGIRYTLTISNVRDRAPVPNPIAENSSKSYTFSSAVLIWIEAETGALTSPMQVATDANASGNSYIHVPNGSGNDGNGQAEYTIYIPQTAEYVIWGRVLAPNGSDDSFYVMMDGDSERLWDCLYDGKSSQWSWDEVTERGNGTFDNPQYDPAVFHLTQGEHRLTIKQREDGTKLDKLLLTTDFNYVPVGMGGSDTDRMDLNLDGKVDSLDIQGCMRVILGLEVNPRADVNGDGEVDQSDIEQIVGQILRVDA
jgi:hypothetical protein